MPAAADFDGSATLVAATLTVAGDGALAGAVYIAESPPELAIVPTEAFPPAIPFTLQVTAVDGLPLLPTVAVKLCIPPSPRLADRGAIPTTTSEIIVTAAEPLAPESAWLVAVTATLAGAGKICGAVYISAPAFPAATVPSVEFPPATPFTLQFTASFVVPDTCA
jgi:hypothetical protein